LKLRYYSRSNVLKKSIGTICVRLQNEVRVPVMLPVSASLFTGASPPHTEKDDGFDQRDWVKRRDLGRVSLSSSCLDYQLCQKLCQPLCQPPLPQPPLCQPPFPQPPLRQPPPLPQPRRQRPQPPLPHQAGAAFASPADGSLAEPDKSDTPSLISSSRVDTLAPAVVCTAVGALVAALTSVDPRAKSAEAPTAPAGKITERVLRMQFRCVIIFSLISNSRTQLLAGFPFKKLRHSTNVRNFVWRSGNPCAFFVLRGRSNLVYDAEGIG
jgi:hypothetical protein